MRNIIGIVLGTGVCWICALVFFVLGAITQEHFYPLCAANVKASAGSYCSNPPNPMEAVICYTVAVAFVLSPLIILAVGYRRRRSATRVAA